MKKFFTHSSYFLLVFLFLAGCKETFDEHYERPDWLKGNAWKVLEERGNYTIFLDAVEKAGFKSLVNGKGVITVVAPDDEAFTRYFQEHGFNSVEDISTEKIKKLIGFHLVYYAFDKDKFANYQPEGVEAELAANVEGTYYKHRTKSRDTLTAMVDVVDGKVKNVFHKERFLPVFSSYLFDSKGIEAAYNYEYFYPESSWMGQGGGFNISNATVNEYSIPTDNGYLYLVDEVVEPLETVYSELKQAPDYSTFISMYDRFTYFYYDEETSREYAALSDSLFILYHTGLPQIGSEWSYNGETGLPDYANLAELSSKAFNVFAPDNQSLDNFFQDFWSEYYTSVSEVDFLPVAYLLYNHVYQGSIVFPEEVTKGTIRSAFGNPIVFDPDTEVEDKKIAVNGAFYGLGTVVVPDMFKSVTAPLFKNPSYNIFLYMMDRVNMIEPLMSDALKFTLFIPSDEVILNTLYGGSNIFWNPGNPLRFGDEIIEVENSEGIRVAMSISAMSRFVNDHIVTEEIADIAGKKVYRTRNPFSYLYVTDGGVASSGTYNLSNFVNAQTVAGDWTNGKAYEVENALVREEGSFKYLIGSATSGTSALQDFSEFSKLLAQAGLIDLNNELTFLFGDNFVLFAPTNEAILAAKDQGIIPTEKEALAKFLKYYFVPVSTNGLNDYPFAGFGVEGDFLTAQPAETENSKLTVTDTGSALEVSNQNGASAGVVSEFPRIYVDGAVYLIDAVIKSE